MSCEELLMQKCEYGSSKTGTGVVLQKKGVLKNSANSLENTCGEHFTKKDSAIGVSQKTV